jgi:hypothetical protein
MVAERNSLIAGDNRATSPAACHSPAGHTAAFQSVKIGKRKLTALTIAMRDRARISAGLQVLTRNQGYDFFSIWSDSEHSGC